jgi:GNAT superfamily N-acetyltransferase
VTSPKRAAVTIRTMLDDDAFVISGAFEALGWNKPVAQYVRYLDEQRQGRRACWVAHLDGYFAGYATLDWEPEYRALVGRGIPEIQDLNVLPEFRRRGVASLLLDHAESATQTRAPAVAVAVGLHPGYNAAQVLYARRGFAPDGCGVTYRNRYVQEGETVRLDDDFVIHLVKSLPRRLKGH